MKIVFSFLLLLVTTILLAQDSPEPEPVVHSSHLQPGELISFGNKSIRFKEVISDSRCPKEVLCVWAGEAKILLEIFENDVLLEEKIMTVNAGNIPLNFSAEGMSYSLNRILLSPYPSMKEVEQNYSLEISITEK